MEVFGYGQGKPAGRQAVPTEGGVGREADFALP